VDDEVVLWLSEHRVPVLDVLAGVLAVIGTGGLVWIALAAVVALRSPGRRLAVAVPVLAAVWGADVLATGLRYLIGRPRPFEALAGVDPAVIGAVGPSLPSGHAATSLAGALVLAYRVPSLAAPLLGLAAAISASRVYAGVHYPTDVIAGAALGATVAAVAVAVVRRRERPPPQGRAAREGARGRV
jgi:undecaprenyl-diphosphatase